MNRIVLLLAVTWAIVLSSGPICNAEEAIEPKEKVVLFDGNSFDGWFRYLRNDQGNVDETWKIKPGGILVCTGKPAGYISHQPWQCEVTDLIRPGRNTVEVTVIGTLKNTLGPHHDGPTAGRAWPGMFHKGPEPGPPPGEKYDTIGYGLFEPFVLKHAAE